MRQGLSVLLCAGALSACGGNVTGTSNATVTAQSARETTQAVATGVGITVRSVRLEATSEVNGNAWSSMAEFNLVDAAGAIVARTGWTVVADSAELVGENAPATNAIDGDPNTIWHTQWQGASPRPPHTFTVDLGTSRSIGGFKYLPRQVGENGRIAGYRFYTSTDGASWTLAAQGTFPNGTSESTVLLNQAPVVAAIAARMDPVNQPVTQIVTATDANGDALSYSAAGLPPGVAIDARTGSISGTPSAIGTNTVTVQVSDGKATTSATFAWTVAATGGVGVMAKHVRLEATSEVNGNAWASIAEFNVLDGGGSSIPRTGWSVAADSQEVIGENGAASNAIDGDPNSFWHTQWQGASPPMPHALTVNLGALKNVGGFKYLPRQVGVNGRIAGYRFYTSADGITWALATSGAFTNSAAEVTVRLGAAAAPPVPPVLVALADRTDPAGRPVSQTSTATDAAGKTLTWSATGLPAGLNIDARNGTISGTPSATGSYAASVQVSNGQAAASSRFSWSITAAIANRSPTLVALPAAREDSVGRTIGLALSGSDPDGDTLTYAATGLPNGLSINAATGVIGGIASQPGVSAVTASVGDGRGGRAAQTFTWSIVAIAAPTAPGATGVNPPIVFNATTSAAAGDVISLQGENFGTSPAVYFDGYPGTPLEIVNRVGTGWLAVQLPTVATGALIVRINNGTGISAAVKLNAARPHHLDTTQLSPGGAFRLFGRNLRVNGSTPSVTVDGLAATIDANNSDEHMLSLTAPAGSKATATASIVADNGNGSGPMRLDRAVSIALSGTGDPFALGVGWAAGFSALANRPIYPATDARIADKAVCNGTHDDAPAIQQAIDLAASTSGGVVQLPVGRCAIGSGLGLKSGVVVRGAGKASTEVYRTGAGYPAVGIGIDLAGISDLTLTNGADNSDSLVLKNSSRVFLKNVRFRLGTSKQMYLSDNVDMVVAGTDIEQTGSTTQQGPYVFNNTAGLVFDGNSTTWVTGAPTFGGIHDSYLHASHFTRNATGPNLPSTVHQLTLDFAFRVAVVGNLLDVAGGPIRDKTRNDGETILTEGGGANRTENVGTVGTATGTTMTDPANTLDVDPFRTGTIPEAYGIAIVSGKGAGQMRHVVAYDAGARTATVDRAWDVVPDGTSHYSTFVFGLEKALIKNNTLSQTPRGIWIYNTGVRDVDIVGNSMSEGGGIYLRSFQDIRTRTFTPIYGVLIKDNRISNTTRDWMSYINIVMVNVDGSAFGTGVIGVEVRNNTLVANRPNVTSNVEEYASTEGMTARMPFESAGPYAPTGIPRVLGTLFTRNTCTYCDVAVRIGTGASGTTILNTALPGSTALYTDTSSVPSGEKSTATVVR